MIDFVIFVLRLRSNLEVWTNLKTPGKKKKNLLLTFHDLVCKVSINFK